MFPTTNQQIIEFTSLGDILNYKNKEEISLTIGSFDAIHLGHQKLMYETILLSKKTNSTPALLTFKNHPRKVLNSEKSGASIFSFEHRMELIFNTGIQKIYVIHFNKNISQLLPIEFIQKILLDSLNCKAIVTGEDFCFGKNRAGNVSLLKEILAPKNILISTIKPYLSNEKPVSTTRIRNLLLEKNIKEVNQLLGRQYSLKGVVQFGYGRGHTLGFPTANIVPDTEIMPTEGVYITNTIYNGKLMPSITNVGINPTFADQQKEVAFLIETHIINAILPLHNELIEVIFIQFVRPEIKFKNAEELKKQITIDIEQAKNFHHIK